jgi:signal transduction histidine kinase/ActR/RegA family two-component response regulator
MSESPDVDARLGQLLEVLLAIARQDYETRAEVSGAQDTLDAIAVGLNMLGEELAHEVTSRRELERAHEELKQAQAKLVHTGKLAAVGQLASGVAHEISNPAMSLEVALAIIKRTAGDLLAGAGAAALPAERAEKMRSALEDAEEAVGRIRRLTGDLRTFARTDDETPQAVQLDEVARVSSRLAAPTVRPRAELVLDLAPVPPVVGDRGRLGQVVTNLLVNAAQAVPEGAPAENTVAVSTRAVDGEVLLAVEDSGPGVPPALRDRIFEPFFTTKPEGVGTGLGLALVAEITAAHHGRIRVTSGKRGGARFELAFPARPAGRAAVPQAAAASAPAPAPAPSARLLLVDDETLIIRLFSTLLGKTCKLVVAESGAEAVELLQGDRAFDLILCDLHMPGVDGIAVYEEVERLEPSLLERFVFTTGGAVTTRSREFLERVQPRVLAKPFPVDRLLALIRESTAPARRDASGNGAHEV